MKARFNWLIRQLTDAPDDLLIETSFPSARNTTVVKLGGAREDLGGALYVQDPKREPKGFVLTRACPMGQKRGRADGSFVKETTGQTIAFYRDIVQHLRAWQPSAPQLRQEADMLDEPSPDGENAATGALSALGVVPAHHEAFALDEVPADPA